MLNRNVRAALGRWDWSAIAAGVVVAIALQIVLRWLGIAFAMSWGDDEPEGGYALWSILVQLGSLFVGAAFAAYLARAPTATDGALVGAFTWALALVLGSSVAATTFGWRVDGGGAWAAFFGAILSLATAVVGGAIGATRGERPLVRERTVGPTTPVPQA